MFSTNLRLLDVNWLSRSNKILQSDTRAAFWKRPAQRGVGRQHMDADFAQELSEQTPDALLAVAPDGAVLHWNRAAEVIFGYSQAEARGRLLTDLIVPADRVDEERRIQ